MSIHSIPPTITAETKNVQCFDARDLTGPNDTAQILLDGQVYVLRITRAGKLILTK
ncbi:MAG: hemin uptake protein HemP [Pseudomonadota bacterium]